MFYLKWVCNSNIELPIIKKCNDNHRIIHHHHYVALFLAQFGQALNYSVPPIWQDPSKISSICRQENSRFTVILQIHFPLFLFFSYTLPSLHIYSMHCNISYKPKPLMPLISDYESNFKHDFLGNKQLGKTTSQQRCQSSTMASLSGLKDYLIYRVARPRPKEAIFKSQGHSTGPM